MFSSRQMADRQEEERKHIMFLNASAGNWHSDSSISQGKSPGQPSTNGAGKVTLPKEGCTAKAHGKGHECMTSNSGREESRRNSNPTCHSILRATGILTRVSRRAVTVIRQQNIVLIASPQRQYPEGLNTPSALLGHTWSPDPKAQLPFLRVK